MYIEFDIIYDIITLFTREEDVTCMSKYKFVLNEKTGTLHKTNCCYYSNVSKDFAKYYETEDLAIADKQLYMKRCKNCFKER